MIKIERIRGPGGPRPTGARVRRIAAPDGRSPVGMHARLAGEAERRIKEYRLGEHLQGVLRPGSPGATSTGHGSKPTSGWIERPAKLGAMANAGKTYRPEKHGKAYGTAGPTGVGQTPILTGLQGKGPTGFGMTSARVKCGPWPTEESKQRQREIERQRERIRHLKNAKASARLLDGWGVIEPDEYDRLVNEANREIEAAKYRIEGLKLMDELDQLYLCEVAGADGDDIYGSGGDWVPGTGIPVRLWLSLSVPRMDAEAPWWHPKRGGRSPGTLTPSAPGGTTGKLLAAMTSGRSYVRRIIGSSTGGHDVVDPDPYAPTARGSISSPMLPKGFGWIDPIGE